MAAFHEGGVGTALGEEAKAVGCMLEDKARTISECFTDYKAHSFLFMSGSRLTNEVTQK